MTVNTIIIIIAALIIILVIALIIVIKNDKKASTESDLPPIDDIENAITDTESLDMIYARENHLWVCCYCETLNQYRSEICAACGEKKQGGEEKNDL